MLRRSQQQALFSHLNLSGTDARQFIEACNELDSQVVITARDTSPGNEGNTLLHEAARVGSAEAVLHLIETGHIVDCIDTASTQVTPLLVAIESSNLEIVEILMRSGASLYHTDIRGDNALHYGAKIGSRMCKLLMRHPELTAFDYRSLLATENVKLTLPVEYAANSYIEQLFTSMSARNITRKGPRRPKGQKPGKISILRVKLIDIMNTELIGKPDIYAILTVGDKTERLPTKQDCNATETWDDLSFSIDVSDNSFRALEVAVYDENKFRKDVNIGNCSLALQMTKQHDWQGGKEVVLVGDLPYKKNEACGIVEITIVVEPAVPPSV